MSGHLGGGGGVWLGRDGGQAGGSSCWSGACGSWTAGWPGLAQLPTTAPLRLAPGCQVMTNHLTRFPSACSPPPVWQVALLRARHQVCGPLRHEQPEQLAARPVLPGVHAQRHRRHRGRLCAAATWRQPGAACHPPACSLGSGVPCCHALLKACKGHHISLLARSGGSRLSEGIALAHLACPLPPPLPQAVLGSAFAASGFIMYTHEKHEPQVCGGVGGGGWGGGGVGVEGRRAGAGG